MLSDNTTSNNAANPLYFYMFRPVIGQQQAGVHNSEQLVIYKVTNMCVCVCVCVLLNRFESLPNYIDIIAFLE